MSSQIKLAVIGGGSMGSAIIHALIHTKRFAHGSILLIEPDAEKAGMAHQRWGCMVQPKMNNLVASCDTVLLAIKPQSSKSVLKDLAPILKEEQLLLSIMAGVSVATIQSQSQHPKIVRVMPNTPAQISEGMSAFFATESVTSEERSWVKHILSACGACLEVEDEDKIDAATAISGSGPAYLFYLAEQMIHSATAMGFTHKQAELLVEKTLRGASLLLESQMLSPEELRKRVTSPGGTTEAATQNFDAKHVGINIQHGIHCAYERAKELK